MQVFQILDLCRAILRKQMYSKVKKSENSNLSRPKCVPPFVRSCGFPADMSLTDRAIENSRSVRFKTGREYLLLRLATGGDGLEIFKVVHTKFPIFSKGELAAI